MEEHIAKKGDTIKWTFGRTELVPNSLKGKTFNAKVAMVNKKEREYGVYCDYGQDLIPFGKATIVKR